MYLFPKENRLHVNDKRARERGGGGKEKISKRGTRRSWIFVSEKPVCLLRLNASAT